MDATALRLDKVPWPAPRVARAARPWALRLNPLGIPASPGVCAAAAQRALLTTVNSYARQAPALNAYQECGKPRVLQLACSPALHSEILCIGRDLDICPKGEWAAFVS